MVGKDDFAEADPQKPDPRQGCRAITISSAYLDDIKEAEPDWRKACTIGLFGDCSVACSYLPKCNRPENHLRVRLKRDFPGQPVLVRNMGMDGESTGAFMKSGRMARVFNRFFHLDIAFIRYGINDRKEDGIDQCICNIEKLCGELRGRFPKITIIIESSMWVDYPAHYLHDRNARLAPLFEAMAGMARRLGLAYVDIFAGMRRETERGNWDLRVRGDAENIIEDDSFDQFYPNDPAFFTNIHPNSRCLGLMADWEMEKIREIFGTRLPMGAPGMIETTHGRDAHATTHADA